MASIRYGTMITDLVGKVGGQNFQRGLASPILRNITTSRRLNRAVNLVPSSHDVKSIFAYVSQYYKLLTLAERTAYAAVCASFPRLNKFGVLYNPSAYQLFVEMNMGLVLSGNNPSVIPPTVSTFVSPTWSISYAGGGGDIVISQSVIFTTAPYKTVITASYYGSSGRGLRKGQMKIIASHQFIAASPSYTISSNYYAIFGSAIPSTLAWFGVKQINLDTGEFNQPVFIPVQF